MISDTELARRIEAAIMRLPGAIVDKGPGEITIAYVEGLDTDGSVNENRHNAFDDVRVVMAFEGGEPKILGKWEATTQPGTYYTLNPLNQKGGAIIELGQQRCWQTGLHRGKYEALIETGGEVKVRRDGKKSYSREGNVLDVGEFGINQHHGGNSPRSDIGGHSAGCLVGRMIDGHQKFMWIVKSDPRYKANNRFVFRTTILTAQQVMGGVVQPRDIVKPQVPKEELSTIGGVLAALGGVGAYLQGHWALIAVVAVIFIGGMIAYNLRKKNV